MDYTTVLVSMVQWMVSSKSIKIAWCWSHVHCNLPLNLHCEGFSSFPSNSPFTLIRRSIPYSPLVLICCKFHNWMLLTSCRTTGNKENGMEFMSPAEQSFIYIVLSWNRSRPVVDPGFPRRLLTQHLITVQGWGPNVPENCRKMKKTGSWSGVHIWNICRPAQETSFVYVFSVEINRNFCFHVWVCSVYMYPQKVTTWK